jgi:hypothetical protein
MSAASTPRTANYAQAAKKGVRRSHANWVSGQLHRAARRTATRNDRPTIVRFPVDEAAARSQRPSREDVIADRIARIQQGWSAAEREQRRLQAIERQRDLALLLASCELEETMRCAVANAEQPIAPPEMEALCR